MQITYQMLICSWRQARPHPISPSPTGRGGNGACSHHLAGAGLGVRSVLRYLRQFVHVHTSRLDSLRAAKYAGADWDAADPQTAPQERL